MPHVSVVTRTSAVTRASRSRRPEANNPAMQKSSRSRAKMRRSAAAAIVGLASSRSRDRSLDIQTAGADRRAEVLDRPPHALGQRGPACHVERVVERTAIDGLGVGELLWLIGD